MALRFAPAHHTLTSKGRTSLSDDSALAALVINKDEGIIRDSILEERYGKHNLRAHYSSFEEFLFYVALIVTPLIGCSFALRLIKAANRFLRVYAWSCLFTFTAFLLQAASICWSQYQKTLSFLHG